MSQTTKDPTIADLSDSWSVESEALTANDVFALNTPGANHDFLYLHTCTGGNIPLADVTIGIEIYIDEITGTTSNPHPGLLEIDGKLQAIDLEFAITLDGIIPYGRIFLIPYWNNRPLIKLGSPTEKFGSIWAPSDFNTSVFGFLIRKPTTEDLKWYDDMDTWDGATILDRPANRTGPVHDIIDFEELLSATRKLDHIYGIIYHTAAEGSLTMERESVRQQIRFGKEVTHGTAVACTHNARAIKLAPQPQADFKTWRPQGAKFEQLQMIIKEWSTASVSGIPTYEELGHWLGAVIGAPVSDGGVVDELNTHTFRFENRLPQDLNSFTFEYGTPADRAHRIKYAIFDAIGMRFTRDDAELTGSVVSHAIEDDISMTGGVDEVQFITFTGTPTGGTFKLMFRGEVTPAISHDALPATLAGNIQTGLEALSGIAAGEATVAETTDPEYSVTFSGALASVDQPMIELFENLLTGGSSPSLDVTESVGGGLIEHSLLPILPGQVDVFLSPTLALIDPNTLTRARLAEWNLSDRAIPYWVMNSAASPNDFLSHTESEASSKFNLKVQADSNGMSILTTARAANTIQWIKIQCTGPDIGVTSDPHRLTILAPVRVSGYGALEDEEGIYHTNFELSTVEDPEAGNSVIVTLENGVVSY